MVPGDLQILKSYKIGYTHYDPQRFYEEVFLWEEEIVIGLV